MSVHSAFILTKAVGNTSTSTGDVAFDDLKDVGRFPLQFLFNDTAPIARLEFAGSATTGVLGIRITYRRPNGELHQPVVRGQVPGATPPTVNLSNREFLVKVSGRVSSTGISQLRFVKLNKDTGDVAVLGPFGRTDGQGTRFVTSGKLFGFSGNSSSGTSAQLKALAFVKEGRLPADLGFGTPDPTTGAEDTPENA